MFEVNLSKTIHAPQETVWQVLLDTANYPKWNAFINSCESSFVAGKPIIMRVNMFPWLAFKQKETIRKNQPKELIEYGVKLPLGMLKSTRQHVLKPSECGNYCHYQSLFCIKGWFSPVVKLMLGRRLKQGFTDMTLGLVKYTEALETH